MIKIEIIFLYMKLLFILSRTGQGSTQDLRTCGGRITGLLEGNIASPGFPDMRYPNNSNCTYEIIVPAGYVVAYRSTFLRLEGRLEGFCFDYVQIFPSGNIIDTTDEQYCGNEEISLRTSARRKLTVVFHSDETETHEGFSLLWSAVKISDLRSMFNCDFDGSNPLCPGWEQSKTDDFDWSFARGATPTANTGPTFDHTTGTLAGRYAFIEASGSTPDGKSKRSKSAELLSPEVALDGVSAYCFELWYHNFGDGSLLLVELYEDQHVYFASIVGDRLDVWQQLRRTIPASNRTLRIGVQATSGSTVRSDVAIDDIKLFPFPCNDDMMEPLVSTTDSTVSMVSTITTSTTAVSTTATSKTTTPQNNCRDILSSCGDLSHFCRNNLYIRGLCERTCEICVQSQQPDIETNCEDIVVTCPSLANLCNMASSIRKICPRTCMVCNSMETTDMPTTVIQPVSSTAPSTADRTACMDLNEERCRRYSASCYMDIFQVVCPRTCGACNVKKGIRINPTISATPTTMNTKCRDKGIDMMFLIDGSGSIKSEDFLKIIQFVKTLVIPFNLRKNKVGLMQYSHWFSKRPLSAQPFLETVIQIGQYTNMQELQNALGRIRRHGHTSYTAHAIEKAVTIDFRSSPRFNDACTKKVIVVVTDGSSSDSSMLALTANKARLMGVTFFAVGVKGYSLSELQVIANGHIGNNERVYATYIFSHLINLIPRIRNDLNNLQS